MTVRDFEPITTDTFYSEPRQSNARTIIQTAVLVVAVAALRMPDSSVLNAAGLIIAIIAPWAAVTHLLRSRYQFSTELAIGASGALLLAGWSLASFVIFFTLLGSSPIAFFVVLAVVFAAASAAAPTAPYFGALRVRPAAMGSGGSRLGLPITYAACAVAGIALIALAMKQARDSQTEISQGIYLLFWAGTIVLLVPVIAQLVGQVNNALFGVIFLAVGSYVHYFLRTPFAAQMYDELGHWGETVQLLTRSRLFTPDSVVAIGPKYPGLETVTAAFSRLSGSSAIVAGQYLVLAFHVVTLLGVAQLARTTISNSDRVALGAALLYSINPSFLEIDSQFSYESFAVPLVVWSLVFALRASLGSARSGVPWAAMFTVVLAALTITHHLSAFVLTLFMLTFLVAAAVRGSTRRQQELRLGQLAGFTIAAAALPTIWALVVRARLGDYLLVFPRSGVSAFQQLFTGGSNSAVDAGPITQASGFSSGRDLFGGSLLPKYEIYSTYPVQVLLLLGFAVAFFGLRKNLSSARWALGLIGAAYFISLPFTLVSGANSGAHRSWAFSYLGVATICAYLMARKDGAHSRTADPGRYRAYQVLGVVSLMIILLGNYASGVNAYQRFAGPLVFGQDGRSVTPDMTRSAQWFAEHEGRGRTVLTTLRMRSVFGSYSGSQGLNFPGWTIFFPAGDPLQSDRDKLFRAGIDFVVVDKRLATEISQSSYFGLGAEPVAPSNPLPAASIAKFDRLGWLERLHSDGNVIIYSVVRS